MVCQRIGAREAGTLRQSFALFHVDMWPVDGDPTDLMTVEQQEAFIVGNVSPSKLAKTKMAKSILDASWAMLRSQLEYKARKHRARYVEADERWTSQACSDCGAVGGPKGIAGLGVRHWTCPCCGSSHDRDVNAARNILSVGAERRPPAVEIPVL